MRLHPNDRRNYPKFTHYVRTELPKLIHVPRIVQVMNNIGQLNRAKFLLALSWNTNPTIRISNLAGAYGEFTPTYAQMRYALTPRW